MRVKAIDWLMLALAIISVALLVYETWGDVNEAQRDRILLIDNVIIGVFALEFLIRWAKDDRPKTFVPRNWYDLVGMIPVSHPAVRAFRLFRLVRIVVLLARFGRAADRAFGEGFTRSFLQRFKSVIVESIGDAITVRVLDETLEVLEKGAYTKNLAGHLEARGDEVTELVMDQIVMDPALARLRHVPFFPDILEASARTTQRVLVEVLKDPRMDSMVKDVIRQNVQQIRAEVEKKESLTRAAGARHP